MLSLMTVRHPEAVEVVVAVMVAMARVVAVIAIKLLPA